MRRTQIGMLLAVLVAVLAVSIWQWREHDVITVATEDATAASAAPLSDLPVVAMTPVALPPAPVPTVAAPPPEFYHDIRPIFDQRCVVCHGGYDAPCRLQLDSSESILRDAMYAQSDLNANVLYRMLALKAAHPQSASSPMTSLDYKPFCPNNETFAQYTKERPLQGMPLGLPALSDEEFATIAHWLEAGAKVASLPPLSVLAQKASADWEHFLNRSDLKSQLMARYLYEHLFLADLYFEDDDAREFFKLVRSRTPPGDPIDMIDTRRPYDDPGVARVYYRLQPYRATIVAKTHLPYALSEKRRQRWQQLFLQSDYTVTQLPSYEPEVAANPFITFAVIPVQSRYRFLLDEANFFIATFIEKPLCIDEPLFSEKPGCRSQVALNVIDAQFWVMFANPDAEAIVDGDFLARESKNFYLPSEVEKQPLRFAKWKKYADAQAKYLAAKEVHLAQKFPKPAAVTLDLLWSGDGDNQNAALTVFRHFDSASVIPGLVGALPKTAWVVDYPMFERTYYLLAAGFDVHGDSNDRASARLYMDFLRMQGETNFLTFLPKAIREKTRSSWYQGVAAKQSDSVYRKTAAYQRESGIHYRSKNSQREFFDLLRARLGPALSQHYDLTDAKLSPAALNALQKIAQLRGAAVASLPETILLRVVIRDEPDRIFTLLHNDARSNVAALSFDQAQRRPAHDTLSVVPGIVGAYPNAFWVVHEDDVPRLARDLAAIRGINGYRALAARVAVSRDSAKFWQESDWVLNTYRNLEPIESGILDYSRYEHSH